LESRYNACYPLRAGRTTRHLDAFTAKSPSGAAMIKIYDKETNAPLGELSDAQLKFLIDQLEEESLDDWDYYLNVATLDVFQAKGADPALLDQLRQALGAREDMEIRWERS